MIKEEAALVIHLEKSRTAKKWKFELPLLFCSHAGALAWPRLGLLWYGGNMVGASYNHAHSGTANRFMVSDKDAKQVGT